MMGSAAVSWSSKKQPIVMLSTTEAEFVATTACACQATWLEKEKKKTILEESHSSKRKPLQFTATAIQQ